MCAPFNNPRYAHKFATEFLPAFGFYRYRESQNRHSSSFKSVDTALSVSV